MNKKLFFAVIVLIIISLTTSLDAAGELPSIYNPDAVATGQGADIEYGLKKDEYNSPHDVSGKNSVGRHEAVSSDSSNNAVPQPIVQISRVDNAEAVKSGEEFTIILKISNIGKTDITEGIFSVSTSNEIILMEDTSSFEIKNILHGQSENINIRLKADSKTGLQPQNINVNFVYKYRDNGRDIQKCVSKKINIEILTKNESKPSVQIGKKDIYEPINAGEELTVTVWFKNCGKTKISDTVAVFKPSDSLSFIESSYSFKLGDLEPEEIRELDIRLKPLEGNDSSEYYLDIDFDYGYINGNVYVQDNKTEKVVIESKYKRFGGDASLVKIGRDNIKSSIKAGEKFSINVSFKNEGDTVITNPTAFFSASECMMLTENSSFEVLPDIKPGETVYKRVYLQMLDGVKPSVQSLNVDLRYCCSDGKKMMKNSISEKFSVAAVDDNVKGNEIERIYEASEPSFETPNIIIKKYGYGNSQVTAGSDFILTLEFANTSKNIEIENITMTLEPVGGISVDSTSNTFHFDKLSAETVQRQDIKMKAADSGKSASPFINVSFNYDYDANDVRSFDVNSEIIEIPVYKPDQFEISAESIPKEIYVGEELNLALNYMNKGESIDNVTAAAEIGMGVFEDIQDLGSIQTGKSGTINFDVVPWETGEFDIKLQINYVNGVGDTVVREFPMEVNVLEEGAGVVYNEIEKEENGKNAFIWGGIGAAFAVGAGIAVIFKFRKRKIL